MSSPFSALKTKALEFSARAFLNRKIEKFGTVTKLEIDRRARSIRLELALKGEAMPIGVDATSYEICEVDGATYVLVHHFDGSRDWVKAALNEYVAGRKFQIPRTAAALF
jgi:hypothetical protein